MGVAEWLLSNGVGPVVVVLLLIGALPKVRLWTDAAYRAQVERAQAAEARAEKAEGKVDAMVQTLVGEVTPTLTRNTDAVATATRLLERLSGERP